jgi:iron uptake system EfeUOB component EfeO/EfeM
MTYTEYCNTFYKPQEVKVKELIAEVYNELDKPIDMRKIDELAYEIETLKRLDWSGYRLLQKIEQCEKTLEGKLED